MYANIDANAIPPHSICPHATGSRSSLPYAANDCSTAELARFSRGQVSGTRRKAVTAQTAPNVVSATNTTRQPPSSNNCPPINGASNGPIDVTMASIDSTRAASLGSCDTYRSKSARTRQARRATRSAGHRAGVWRYETWESGRIGPLWKRRTVGTTAITACNCTRRLNAVRPASAAQRIVAAPDHAIAPHAGQRGCRRAVRGRLAFRASIGLKSRFAYLPPFPNRYHRL